MKFKKNISIKTILMAIIFMIALRQELNANFLVSEVIYENSRVIFIVCILISVVVGLYFRKRLEQNRVNANRSGYYKFYTGRPILFHFGSTLIFSVMLIMLSFKVLPHLYTIAFGDDGEMTVQVYTTDYDNGRYTYCGYGFRAHLYLVIGGKVCRVKQEIWKTLKQGDFVKLEGKMTWFGIIPYSVVKLTNS